MFHAEREKFAYVHTYIYTYIRITYIHEYVQTYIHPHTICTHHYKILNFLKCRNTTATRTIDEMPHFASYSSETLESVNAKYET